MLSFNIKCLFNPSVKHHPRSITDYPVQGIPTIPSTLQEELDTNPFLRPNDPAIRKKLGQCQY